MYLFVNLAAKVIIYFKQTRPISLYSLYDKKNRLQISFL